MATETKPVPKKVQDAVRRQKSRMRHVAPATLALLRLVMFVAVAGGCCLGVYCLWKKALADPRFRMDGETLALAGAVRECPESVAELESIGKRFAGRCLLDPLLVSDMEEAYGGSVWIKKITRMRRRFPNRIEVEFLLRLPAAQVWHDSRYWLVDGDATLLPVAGSDKPFPNLPEVVGVTSRVIGGRPEAGKTWQDEGVSGALGIMRAFWGSPLAEAFPVDRVVVNTGTFRDAAKKEAVSRPRFEVVATDGAVVRWGTFNAGELDGELSSSEKLWQLQELFRREPALDPGVCFDVRTRLPGFSLLQ